ncbi:MAG TPA: helix-turn-helix transcriptional regulator [Candidatus Baltobacteraceae bacterium]|nr:helix-turn-helix transcriptional regulator [Candidatus Baltobacteraceae bacterium]
MKTGYCLQRTADPDIAEIAALIGERGRAAMLMALLDGRELTASELALRAGMSPQAATAHLKKLAAAGLLAVRPAGRNRFFRIGSAEVGHAVEGLAAIAPPARIVALGQSTALERLRRARSCYDHLAGELGVGVTHRFIERGAIVNRGSAFELTPSGERLLHEFGIDVERARAQRRSFARTCLDWTQRRPHLAGSLGASVFDLFLRNSWVTRSSSERSLRVTPEGRHALEAHFGLTWRD